jgi:long-chain acyl-CoA synthetase
VVIQGYGLTETTSMISVNHPFKVGKGSIGQVLPGREIKVDANGEILVRGENIASAYWQGSGMKPLVPEADGWFHTGDLGELDTEGNLYFKGRSKNVIVTPEGMNVHPEDLEAALRRQAEVRDCVVIGLPRNGNAEPCAVLILETGADGARVMERVNASLPEFQRMRQFVVWPDEDFPRTSTQKPRTREIAEVAIAKLQSGATVASGVVQRSPQGGVAELIGRISRHAHSGGDGELNLSSLDRVDLLCAIEDRYQVDVDERAFSEAKTVAELEALVRQPPASHARDVYPRWAQRWPITWIRFAAYYVLVWPTMMVLGAPKIEGREKLRAVRGPVLVIANHVTYLDGAFVLAALPFHLRHRLAVAMEGDRLRLMRNPPKSENMFARWANRIGYFLVVGVFNVFPLPQRTGVRESFRYAGECVDRGYSVLVFPEGRRTPDGELQPFRAGIGMLAKSLRVPVVAMRIKGLWELKQRGKRTARPDEVSVEIAEPVKVAESATQEEIARRLEAEMRAL